MAAPGWLLLLTLTGLRTASCFVEELNDSFMELRGKDEMWLIKFYAPWCTFCKRLDPVWRQIGSELRSIGSPVYVGKVDATSSTVMAKEFRVRTYPAIVLLKNELKYNYIGPKTKDSILDFTHRVSGPPVRALSSAQLLEHALSRHHVMFLYIGATSDLKSNFSAAAQELIVHTNFFSTNRDLLPKWVSVSSFPAVVLFKDGTYFPFDPQSDGELKSWMNRERFPTFSKIDSITLYSMGDSGKLVLLALVGRCQSEESLRHKALVQSIATNYRSDYSSRFYFGFMEETEFISGLLMSDNVTVPSFIAVNLSNDGYFLPTAPLQTVDELRHFLDSVLDGSLQGLGGNSVPQRIRRAVYDISTSLRPVFREAPGLGLLLVMIPTGVILSLLFLCTKARPRFGEEEEERKGVVSTATHRQHKHRKSD